MCLGSRLCGERPAEAKLQILALILGTQFISSHLYCVLVISWKAAALGLDWMDELSPSISWFTCEEHRLPVPTSPPCSFPVPSLGQSQHADLIKALDIQCTSIFGGIYRETIFALSQKM